MYKQQILYRNTNKVCYLQYLMSTSHGENEVHKHVTHNSAKLHIRQPLNENGKNMLQYQGPYIWNNFSEAVINSQNVFTFKKIACWAYEYNWHGFWESWLMATLGRV